MDTVILQVVLECMVLGSQREIVKEITQVCQGTRYYPSVTTGVEQSKFVVSALAVAASASVAVAVFAILSVIYFPEALAMLIWLVVMPLKMSASL
jgi:hypothetical protein